ncbi:kynureninase [Stackebrandtia nassauensis]|uniref:Kynureninase n=1 Tax=Stackebrandtia nassauensis (strain DSM 44728 / CIP 108903 / NRRL B-16338 / NBRC 102104 / LLR-40K-21) TaxID=446470 RepID=D3Q6N0_STANL|nr:kynureninase [Stackebrandtia nassauensis]ADD44273.1 kynureninase [Stackebrandtia nassauensis DSM 44728]
MFSELHPEADPATLDAADPLASFRSEFAHDTEDLIYLDGNSLGRPPRAVLDAVRRVTDEEWTNRLIRGWDEWIELPSRAGDALAADVVGARPGEVLVCDSTSVNLYKLAAAALDAAPKGRRVIVTDDDNFPTDRYILAGIAERHGGELRVIHTDIDEGVDPKTVAKAVKKDTALLCLSHVSYRSGAIADMAAITERAHKSGAKVLWDLCHSAGAVPVELDACGVDLAVGCTYKYLNAGPGAPAFLYVREELQTRLRQPMWGWFSQTDQFAMGPEYLPREDIGRFAVGTPTVVGVAAVEAAVAVTARAGVAALREKSVRLGAYAQALFAEWLAPLGFELASPDDPLRRGGHLTLAHKEAWRIGQAMRARGVIPDYREPDRLRLGFAPLYNGYRDVHEGLSRVADIVRSGEYEKFPAEKGQVT